MDAMKKKAHRSKKKVHKSPAAELQQGTILWMKEMEADDYIKVPRCFLRLGHYDPDLAKQLQPRHICLILALQAMKFQNKPIRAYWAQLADDLGVKPDTVRKWGYELRDMELLKITPVRKRDPEHRNKYGVRNDRNIFSLSPLVKRLGTAFGQRKADRIRFQEKRENSAS